MALVGVHEEHELLLASFERAQTATGNFLKEKTWKTTKAGSVPLKTTATSLACEPKISMTGDLGTFVNMICEGRISKGLKNFMRRLRALREQFGLFDDNGNGLISAQEVGTTLTKLFGWRPTRFDTDKIIGPRSILIIRL